MTVLDSSAIVDFLLATGVSAAVQGLLEEEREVAAPDLVVMEVLAVLRREASRDLTAERASAAVHDLGDVGVTLFPSLALRDRAWELRRNFTIADALFISERTVKFHANALYQKLGVTSRTEAVSFALQNRLISLDETTV